MIVRLILILCSAVMFASCAHISPLTHRQRVAHNITSAFVRVHTSVTYEIKRCNPEQLTQCREIGLGITGPSGIGSGGIIAHTDSSSIVLTAAHVVERFGQTPSSNPSVIQGVIRAYAGITGTPLAIARIEFQEGILIAEGIETIIFVAASDGNDYQIESIDCHDVHDVCLITTAERINNTPLLTMSSNPPVIGDKVQCAQGPFGYAIPGIMVPLFEGIFSGSTPQVMGALAKDYYTFSVAPGSSGSLIVNRNGEIWGVVTMFMSGPFCAEGVGCHAMSSGITVSVPFTDIQQFVTQFLLAIDREES